MNRREFGLRAFRVAAGLGLTSISLGLVEGCAEPARGIDDAIVPGSGRALRVLIIGSGYGSAVTALRLTESGIPVTMLEAGRLWDTPASDGKVFCKPFNPDGRAMWFEDKTETQIQSFFGLPTAMKVPVEAGIFDRVNSRAGTKYSEILKFKDNALFGDQVTYHPIGGMPLGEATDDYGRIREYPGLYVVDGSLIPIGIGANPSLSITALAERNVEHVLAMDFG